jgi:nitroreductase
MDIIQVINDRRSIRKYKSDPVDDKTVEMLIDAARKAPSWGNSQCWHFVIVRNPDIKDKLADTLFGVTDRPNSVVLSIKQAPVVIAICAELKKSGTYHREPAEYATDKGEYWYMFDTALATENLSLAAHSMGLGTVIAGAFDAQAAARILKAPAGFVVVALTPLGYPAEAPHPRPRKDIGEILHKETF